MRDPDQKTTNQAIAYFESKLLDRLNVPVIMENFRRGIDEGLQFFMTTLNASAAFAFESSVLINLAEKWRLNETQPVEKCLTMLTTAGNLSAGFTRKSVIAHEAFHCLEFPRKSGHFLKRQF